VSLAGKTLAEPACPNGLILSQARATFHNRFVAKGRESWKV
jgi:hypothetical protein